MGKDLILHADLNAADVFVCLHAILRAEERD